MRIGVPFRLAVEHQIDARLIDAAQVGLIEELHPNAASAVLHQQLEN